MKEAVEEVEVEKGAAEEGEEAIAAEEAEETVEEEVKEEIAEEVEEKKEAEKAKKQEVEEIVEERIYTIPLGRAWVSSRKKRAPRAVSLVKSFIQRHMKPEALVVGNEVNEKIWGRGIEKPPRKIRVRAVKDKEGTVTLHLAEGD